jgi:hypothetical protein
MAVQCGMPISEQSLRECIHNAGFPLAKREFVFLIITVGLTSFRENRVRSYYDASGKTIKKPTSAHSAAPVGMTKPWHDMY